ncbi:MAG: class I SAM-dependent methyltransferase [Bacteroidia bacterium]|nr:class I SAM-dependent methyltransferase [Bacteroidia bacterium]HQU99622.1 class I SAM-dependent methyltransferase [Bacteroidia bacterium]
MSFQSVNQDWEGLAKQDAMWAILTNPDKAGNKWQSNDFFKSGLTEIQRVFSFLNENKIRCIDNNKALDFGCGVGRLTHALATHFDVVDGIDVSATMVEKAEKLKAQFNNNTYFFVNQNTTTAYTDNTFSCIYTSIVLQHIPQPQQGQYIAEFTRILKPGGLLIFQIPTKDIRNLSWFQKIKIKLQLRKRLAQLGIGTYHHMQMNPLPTTQIIEILNKGNCQILQHVYTNHTDIDFGGNLKFIDGRASKDYESSFFVVQKKIQN